MALELLLSSTCWSPLYKTPLLRTASMASVEPLERSEMTKEVLWAVSFLFSERLLQTIFKTLYVHRPVANRVKLWRLLSLCDCGGKVSPGLQRISGRQAAVQPSHIDAPHNKEKIMSPHKDFCLALTCYSSFPIPFFPDRNKSALIVSILPSFVCGKHVKTTARYLRRVILTMSLCLRGSWRNSLIYLQDVLTGVRIL